MKKNTQIVEIGVSAFLFAVAVFLFFQANANFKPASGGALASMSFPRIVFAAIAIFCLLILINGLISLRSLKEQGDDSTIKALFPFRSMITLVAIGIYAGFWKIIGFSLSTFVFFVVVSLFLSKKPSLKKSILIGLGTVIVMVFIFQVLFKVQFPEPILESIRGY